MAIQLKHEGIEDFVLIERGDDVGGTWWAKQLSRLPVRHPLQPVLVLIRAQPGLGPCWWPPPGLLSEPSSPALPGFENFEGKAFTPPSGITRTT